MQRLVLDRNSLSSIRPDQVDKLSKLKELYLEHNSLTKLDFIPSLRNLQTLFVGFNKLAVSIFGICSTGRYLVCYNLLVDCSPQPPCENIQVGLSSKW